MNYKQKYLKKKRIKKQLYKGTKVKIEVCRLANGKEYKIAP